jgi:hypothetical protein
MLDVETVRTTSPVPSSSRKSYLADFRHQSLGVLRRRFGRPAAKVGVLYAVEPGHVGSGRFEQGVGDTAAAAVQRVVGDRQAIEVGVDVLQRVVVERTDEVFLRSLAPLVLGERVEDGEVLLEGGRPVGQRW